MAAWLVLATYAAGVSGIGGIGQVGGVGRIGVTRNVAILVEDHQSPDYPWNPSGAGENQHDQHRAASLVQHSQWREDNR